MICIRGIIEHKSIKKCVADLFPDSIGANADQAETDACKLRFAGARTPRLIVAKDLGLVEHAGAYDVVTCMELLEHVPEPASTVAACASLLKPGGHLFFSTINRNPKAYVFAVIGAEYLLKLLPKGTHDYLRFIKPSELAAACRSAGLRCEEFTGMSYNPLSKQYRLGEDCSVNYIVHCLKEE